MEFCRSHHLKHLVWRKKWEFPEDSDEFDEKDVFDIAQWMVKKLDLLMDDLPLPVLEYLHGID